VLEVGRGRGVGSEVILDRLGAERVTAFDLDEAMVEHARRRLHERPVSLSVGALRGAARHVLDMWATSTFTVHPRENRFGGALFVGAARRS
jgi:predicted O-methyltransferase YrrM